MLRRDLSISQDEQQMHTQYRSNAQVVNETAWQAVLPSAADLPALVGIGARPLPGSPAQAHDAPALHRSALPESLCEHYAAMFTAFRVPAHAVSEHDVVHMNALSGLRSVMQQVIQTVVCMW